MKSSRIKLLFNIFTLFALLISLLGSAVIVTPVRAAGFTVTKIADTADGVCDSDCSLREAITAANALGGADTITLPADTYTLTIPNPGGGENANASGDLDITDSVDIIGAGADVSIIDGGALERVFHVTGAFTVNISGVTVRNGAVGGSFGGGIRNDGTLTITNSTFSGNSATGGSGGGISNNGTLTITNSTFSGNSTGGGGGIDNVSGTTTITNSTFFANSANAGGGIRNVSGTTTITNSTFSDNIASIINGGGGIRVDGGTVTLYNTIVANSINGDCFGVISADISNLATDGSCGSATQTTIGDLDLEALANNGGPTQTVALGSGSYALGQGNNAVCAATPVGGLDQRGIVRPVSGCDVGAFEANAQPGPAFVVNTAEDSTDGSCDEYVAGITDCTLREAITYANLIAGTETITFAANYTITLGSQLPAVTDTMIINGNGMANTIIQANAAFDTAIYRVFEVTSAGNLTLDSLTVQNGRCNGSCATSTTDGGGIYNVGDLTLTNSKVSNSSATNGGGGIYTAGVGSTLTVINSIFSGDALVISDGGGAIFNNGTVTTISNSAFFANFTNNAGGAIYNNSSLTIANSTFSGNTATGNVGGAIYNNSSLTIKNVTLSGNSSASNGDGIYNNSSGALNLYNTVIANSSENEDCFNNSGTVSGNNNLIENVANSCGFTNGLNGNIIGSNSNLGALTGSPAYFPLNALSPAIDAGDNAVCLAAPVGNASQNGITRPQDGDGNNTAVCDIGSFEKLDITAPSVSMSSTATDPTSVSPIAVTVTFSESVTGFISADITATNGTISGFAGSGANYTFNLTPTANGTVTANIAASVVQDSASNNNTAAAQFSRVYDSTAPSVSMSSTATDPTSVSPIVVTVIFSESVTGFISADITATNGTISGFAGSGASYTFNLTPSANGTVTANIAASVAQDLAGNNNTAAVQFSRTYNGASYKLFLPLLLR